MTTDKPKIKRTLAREILFFFAGLGLIGFVWFFLLIRNTYYENKINSCSGKIKTLQIQLDSLPKDYIKEFYGQVSRYFVVNYKLGQDSFAIPKEQEETFLNDKLGKKKNVTLMPIYPKGYSYFHFKDSTVVFDFVSIEEFRNFVSSEDYQDKLYSVFANNSGKEERAPPLWAIPAEFDPMKPYNSTFSLGTLSEFKSKMNISLTVAEKQSKITYDIADLETTIANSKNSKLTPIEVRQNIINSALIIGLLLYVLRLSIVLILWAIRTIKH